MPGLVEELNIASDGEENLLHALAIPLPFRLDTPEKLFNFVKAWLEEKGRDFGPESQGDGTDKGGWRVSCGRDFYEICRVEARWNYYGK